MSNNERLDKLIFEKGLAPSRERAQAYIMSGIVLVNEQPVTKPGTRVGRNAIIRVKGSDQPFVGRGGLKIQGALEQFNISVRHKIAMDIGASTGGFTDCLLQNGAAYVFAIDVGHNQLAWSLVSNPHVKNLEKTNFRHMPFSKVGTFVDLIVIDVSFISLTKIIGNCHSFLTKSGDLIALIKPQFEAGKKNIVKRGIVTDQDVKEGVIQSVQDFAISVGFLPVTVIPSPITGKKSGNEEFLIHLRKKQSGN